MRSETALFNTQVKDVMRRLPRPMTVRPETTCRDLVEAMRAGKVPAAVVVDGGGRPLGIITEQDVVSRIAFAASPETPVGEVMTSPVLTVQRREYLYHAIAWMRRNRLHSLPVIDSQGVLCGILSLDDALMRATERTMNRIDRLSHEGTLDGLKEVKAAQVELAEDLFAEEFSAPDIQALLTRINNDMYRRIGDAALRDMAATGWGEPPVNAATIVMGSGGRGESFLFPDQDNAFVIADYPDAEHNRIDAFFLELAERMTRDLDSVGIRYCNGYCMAINPLWRKTLPQWIEQIGLWGRRSDSVSVRYSDIFFDFQPVWGDPVLAHALRRKVTDMARSNSRFLRQMYEEEAGHNVALGIFGGFSTEKEKKEYKGQVDLKYAGTIPLVEAIRLLALREGVAETSTFQRIAALHARSVLTDSEREDLTGSFHLLTRILLTRQIEDFKAGRRVGYHVNPDLLAKRERGRLLDSLKTIDLLRRRVRAEFTGQVL